MGSNGKTSCGCGGSKTKAASAAPVKQDGHSVIVFDKQGRPSFAPPPNAGDGGSEEQIVVARINLSASKDSLDGANPPSCGPFYPGEGICEDANAWLCSGGVLLPSVFFVPNDITRGIYPLTGPKVGGIWISGDFRVLGTVQRLRAALDTWAALLPHNPNSDQISVTSTSGVNPVEFTTYKTAAPAQDQYGTQFPGLLGHAIQVSLYGNNNNPEFRMDVATSGYKCILPLGVPVDRTFSFKWAPWMYNSGRVVFLHGARVNGQTETGLFTTCMAQDDPSSITLGVPTGLLSGFAPSITSLGPDGDLSLAVMSAVNIWAMKVAERRT